MDNEVFFNILKFFLFFDFDDVGRFDKKKKFFFKNFRYFFWSDWGFYLKIEVLDLLGLNRRMVVLDDMLFFWGMVIDYKENLLYWVDSYKNMIESV